MISKAKKQTNQKLRVISGHTGSCTRVMGTAVPMTLGSKMLTAGRWWELAIVAVHRTCGILPHHRSTTNRRRQCRKTADFKAGHLPLRTLCNLWCSINFCIWLLGMLKDWRRRLQSSLYSNRGKRKKHWRHSPPAPGGHPKLTRTWAWRAACMLSTLC
jgi:hypothetical protein